ncbi:MAG TPA: ribulose-phosphate 3-epimerase [Vicinamibacterales bacterium]|nr:ribulose-phosphate 3-epimerase [Vicinamibacterales bacterium]
MAPAHPIVAMFEARGGAGRAAGPSLSVGLLAADLMALGGGVARLERAGVRLAHFDVMDGCYVPTLTVGPPFVKAVRTSMLKDVHLMIREPLPSLREYVAAGADLVTIHPDACAHPHRALQWLGEARTARDPERAVARGVALNPGVPLGVLEPLIDEVELVTLVAINPGWGGQACVPSIFRRIDAVRERIAASGRAILLAVDGGITRDNVGALAGRGVDIVVTGSAVFDGDVEANLAAMTAALRG